MCDVGFSPFRATSPKPEVRCNHKFLLAVRTTYQKVWATVRPTDTTPSSVYDLWAYFVTFGRLLSVRPLVLAPLLRSTKSSLNNRSEGGPLLPLLRICATEMATVCVCRKERSPYRSYVLPRVFRGYRLYLRLRGCYTTRRETDTTHTPGQMISNPALFYSQGTRFTDRNDHKENWKKLTPVRKPPLNLPL